MRVIISICFVMLLCNIACNDKKGTPSNQPESITVVKRKPKEVAQKNCLLLSDTILNADNWVKYVSIGKSYLVVLKVNKVVDTLDFAFDCNTPQVLIPQFLWKKRNSIFLAIGSGFHFRELVVCTQIGDSIAVQRFRSDNDYDAQYDFAYKFDNERYVNLYSMLHKVKRKILLPVLYQNKHPVVYRISKKRLRLEFEDSVFNTSVILIR